MTSAKHLRPARRLFLVEADDRSDTLLRLLGPLALRQLRVLALEISPAHGGLVVRLETEPMDDARAQQLADKLATLPVVRRVATGWLGPAPPQ